MCKSFATLEIVSEKLDLKKAYTADKRFFRYAFTAVSCEVTWGKIMSVTNKENVFVVNNCEFL
jgi:hypothetical protein